MRTDKISGANLNGGVFGVMLDMSRNAVMKVDKVKEYVDLISSLGYNALLLYTEDTFEVNGEPYFGYLRGRYSKSDLKEIDLYCRGKGIELIPCIQTLAHLNGIFKWSSYNEALDVHDILLIDSDKTYSLIENMFSTLAECFTSRKVHIGFDEAAGVGSGEYKRLHGEVDAYELIGRHLKKVISIAAKYNFKPIMWSDMFFRLLNGGEYYGEKSVTREVKNCVPDGVGLVYWDYYTQDKKKIDFMFKQHKQLSADVWFAGGAWCWCGFTPDNAKTEQTMLAAMPVARRNGISNVIVTVWGDDGRECSPFAVLPALCRIKCAYDGITDIKTVKRRFESATGENYDAMYALSLPNRIFGKDNPWAAKYVLYCDLFNCFMDNVFSGEEGKKCLSAAKRLNSYAKNSRFPQLYETASRYLKVLSLKYDLPFLVRQAYKSGDKPALLQCAARIAKLITAVKKMYSSFTGLWFSENSPVGFDVQDIRFGGLIARLAACKARIENYVSGKLERIEELDADFLPDDAIYTSHTCWGGMITANVLTMGVIK